MIDDLKQNIKKELEILREISSYSRKAIEAPDYEKKLIENAIDALKNKIKIINNSVPEILKGISLTKRLPSKSDKTKLEKISFKGEFSDYNVVLKAADKERFLNQLNISEVSVKKLKKRKKEPGKEETMKEYKSPRGYLKLANKMFLKTSSGMIKKGYFKGIYPEIRKANFDILFQTYIAMLLFTVLLSIFAGIFLMIFFIFFNVSPNFPFVSVYSGEFIPRLLKIFWIPLAVPILTFFALYFYPNTEKGSIGKKIDQEIPFAVVHMSAIAQSGIEPTKIFKIIGLSKEYPNFSKEIRKILNQINLYGYDLVTALNNVSKSTPSTKTAELFAGLSTTINSGGDLGEFFDKRAETLLVGYRLEREKFTKIAETFMDIYISVVVATPMILLLLLIMISVSGIDLGFSPNQITFLIIGIVAIVNMIFIGVLHFKQPAY